MELRDDQEQTLSDVGEQILAALPTVAQAAQRALTQSLPAISSNALVNPSNRMVGAVNAERNIDAINSTARENLRRLLREPFVARVEVDWGGGGGHSVQTYYFLPTVCGLADGRHQRRATCYFCGGAWAAR